MSTTKLKYGMNFTASDAAKVLEQNAILQNGVRSWRQIFGNAGLVYEGQKGALQSDYASAIAEAYRSNLNARGTIFRTGLSTGDMASALHTTDANLEAAYNTYLQKYAQDVTALDQAYAQEIGAYTDDLKGQGENVSNLLSSAYRYWADELSGASRMKDTTDPTIVGEGGDAELGEGVTQVEEKLVDLYNMGQWYNVNSAGERESLKTWEELAPLLINPDGTLNDKGRQFFDQIFGIKPEGFTTMNDKGEEHTTRNFAQWLSDTNPDLYTWAMSPDAANYTRAGTNLGTTKTLLGLESTDADYADYEYADWSKLDNEYAQNLGREGLGKDLFTTFAQIEHDWQFGEYERQAEEYLAEAIAAAGNRSVGQWPSADEIADSYYWQAYDEANKALPKYVEDATNIVDNLMEYSLTQLGTKRYDDFKKAYPQLFVDIEQLNKDALALTQNRRNDVRPVREIMARYETWQTAYIDALKKFITANKKTVSGY